MHCLNLRPATFAQSKSCWGTPRLKTQSGIWLGHRRYPVTSGTCLDLKTSGPTHCGAKHYMTISSVQNAANRRLCIAKVDYQKLFGPICKAAVRCAMHEGSYRAETITNRICMNVPFGDMVPEATSLLPDQATTSSEPSLSARLPFSPGVHLEHWVLPRSHWIFTLFCLYVLQSLG